MFLTCCRNGGKVLEPTPLSPVTDQLKLDELDLLWIVEGEVKTGGSSAITCVNQLILHQGLPRAVLVH